MADVMSTAVSGLLAFQRALDTTSQNIANAATPGYSRQRVDLVTRPGQPFASGWVGSGVQVASIERVYDQFLTAQARSSSSSYSRYETLATEAGRLDNVLGDAKTGLAASFQNLINSFQEVANEPSSITARQVLLSQADVFADKLAGYDARLRTFDSEINTRLKSEAAAITRLSQGIAQLNGEIAEGIGRTGQPPNDLLDQRDRLIDELATHVDVTTVGQDDGSLNVFIGTGQPLVVGREAGALTTVPDRHDPTRLTVALRSGSSAADLSKQITGGSLGGLVEYRRDVLDPARDALGQVAAGIVAIVNDSHANGMDLRGQAGGPFFSLGSPTVLTAGNNAGNATVQAAFTDVSALAGKDYILQFNGAWELRNAATGAAVPMTGSGTSADPFVAEGLSFTVGGTPQPGDSFRIEPTRDVLVGFELLIKDPAAVAAARPITTAAATGNTGSGAISAPAVVDIDDPQFATPATIAFTSATAYTINGDGPHTLGADGVIEANGWRVRIEGAPAAGDEFTVASNTGGSGDNGNLLDMIGALGEPMLGGGTTSIADAAGQLVSRIGSHTAEAQANRDAFQIVHEQDVAARGSVSGVNLDEEAANLVMLQQAYAAAAQVIAVAQSMFDSLLAATRR